MKSVMALCLLIALLSGCTHSISHTTVIAIQPIGTVAAYKIDEARRALEKAYQCRVVILKSISPTSEAFVNIKTPRYRADKLIARLKENKPDTLDYIIGITELDISTTKRDALGRIKEPKSRYEDFGIFGLGYCPGKSCIVSTFRLGTDAEKLKSRLTKITVHEIGHNLGLPHCPDKKCVMTDAVEKLSTVDAAKNELCAGCRKQIE
jgi:archaemetzincin